MISVPQAERMILDNVFPSADEWVSLYNLRDEWLKDDLEVDQSDPRFHRVSVDGVAIDWRVWHDGHRFFSVLDSSMDSNRPLSLAKPYECVLVKAGESLPPGTDCVVPIESVSIRDGMVCISNSFNLHRWDYVQRSGSCFREGDIILTEGSQLRSPEWAAAASAGIEGLRVAERPQVSLLTMGWSHASSSLDSSLTSFSGPSKYGVLSSLKSHGFDRIEIHRLEDRGGEGKFAISQLLRESQVVLFTDGAMQRIDRENPDVLTRGGIEKVFRGVAQQPGAEFFFGIGPDQQLIFGLPSDPTASLLIVHRYVLPALTSIVSGQLPFARKGQPHGVLTEAVWAHPRETSFIPVTIQFTYDGMIEVQPITVEADPRLMNLVGSDGFIEVPPGHGQLEDQETVPLWLWRQPWL